MATRKPDITALVNQSMEGRTLTPTVTAPQSAGEPAKKFQKTPKQAITVRFDDGDYETLQRIAAYRGTTAASLVREAVKTLIRGVKAKQDDEAAAL
jgi:hypothetical protein